MPRRKQPPVPPWPVIPEDIRSQNRSTIEALEAARLSLEGRIERLDQDSRSRDSLLELAIRDVRLEVQQNTAAIRQTNQDIQDLARKVVAPARLEDRVSALERHRA